MPRALALTAVLLLLVPAAASAQRRDLHVALGDSWSVGIQPTGEDRAPQRTAAGWTRQLRSRLRAGGRTARLVELGCSGATSEEMFRGRTDRSRPPCTGHRQPRYRNRSARTSQLRYAERYLRRHRRELRLVSINISGNDLTPCVRGDSPDLECINAGLRRMRTNVAVIARRVREAAGRRARIIGLGYPDLYLSYWVRENTRGLAGLSVGIFRDQWMPLLRRAYARRNIDFIDLARVFDSYEPLEPANVNVPPYGNLPAPVARICLETWHCSIQDIHPNRRGYERIARAVLARLT
jgi:lysophospholipase L1-like esterase